jgi:hypothetical protein
LSTDSAVTQGLRGTQVGRQGDAEQSLKACPVHGGEEDAGLFECECAFLAGVVPRQRDVASSVESDEVPADRLSKGGVEDSVGEADRTGGKASVLSQFPVEFLDQQGAEPEQEEASGGPA